MLTFPVLVAFILSAWKGGLQTLLDELFESLTGQAGRLVTKSAVSQARQKLKASAFEALNAQLLAALDQHWPERRWQGLRLVAVDATTLRLPNNPENQAEFGVQTDPTGQTYVAARVLGLYSTASGRLLKTVLAGYRAAERTLLAPLLAQLNPDDLAILDRGYPASWLFAAFGQQNRHFLARIDGATWPEVQAFAQGDAAEQTVTRPVTPGSRRSARDLGVGGLPETVTYRLIRVRLTNGKQYVLATSLLDSDRYPAADFAELYHQRWGIEEAFKVLKHRLMIEQFSGESPEAIRQDLHAKVFTANLAKAMTYSSESEPATPSGTDQVYLPNLTYAVARLRYRLFGWLLQKIDPVQVLSLLNLIAKTQEIKRPNRTSPRHKTQPKPRRQYK